MQGDKPPSYSNLSPPTFDEAIADRARAKRAACARQTVTCLSAFLISVCLVLFLFSVIFGFWMAQCERNGHLATVSLQSSFGGEGTKKATVKIDGGITITPSSSLNAAILTSLLITSPKEQKNPAQENIILRANESHYDIIKKKGFWRCSRFSARVAIFEPSPPSSPPFPSSSSPLPSPLSLEAVSSHGDIKMEEFKRSEFRTVMLKAMHGMIVFGGAKVLHLLSLRAGGEGIGVFHSHAPLLELWGDHAVISMGNITSSTYTIKTKTGNILSSTLFLPSSPPSFPCEANIFTSSGTIQLNLLSLDPLSPLPCKLSLGSKKGNISLTLAHFSGRYSVQSNQGNAWVSAGGCEGGRCSGMIEREGGGVEHQLVVMSHSGNVSVSFL